MAFNPKFQVNLKRVFNRAFSDLTNKQRDQLRETLADPVFRSTYGKMVIDEIVERTLKGVDRNSVKFAAYSKSYRKSDIFKIYQKSAGDINLKLTGEMLASMVSKGNGSGLSIELLGAENQSKAHGHVYGLGKRKVKRDFLGLPDKDLERLMRDAVMIARNDAYQAAMEYYDNTSMSDTFGQVGDQPEFATSIFTNEVLALLAQELL